MKACDPRSITPVGCEGLGPSVTVVINQDADDPGGWRIDLFVDFPDNEHSSIFVATFLTTQPLAPTRPPARIAAIACFPGASGWRARVHGPQVPPLKPMQVGVFCGQQNATPFTLVQP